MLANWEDHRLWRRDGAAWTQIALPAGWQPMNLGAVGEGKVDARLQSGPLPAIYRMAQGPHLGIAHCHGAGLVARTIIHHDDIRVTARQALERAGKPFPFGDWPPRVPGSFRVPRKPTWKGAYL